MFEKDEITKKYNYIHEIGKDELLPDFSNGVFNTIDLINVNKIKPGYYIREADIGTLILPKNMSEIPEFFLLVKKHF